MLGTHPITYESLKDLKYCLAVFNETLRLHSNVAVARKQAVKDDVLPSGTKVYKGEYVEYSPWIMVRSSSVTFLVLPLTYMMPSCKHDRVDKKSCGGRTHWSGGLKGGLQTMAPF